MNNKSYAKTLTLSSLGGMLEFYDFIIFVFFTKVITELFFPSTLSPFWATMNTYGAFAAGYFARPLGGIVMAHFGDKFGRKNMFMLSILLMVIPTFALGLMPTFQSIGYAAPIILLLVRIMQGIAIGGELPGAWVYVCEHNKGNYLGLNMGLFTSAVVSGILLGSIVTLFVNVAWDAQTIKEWAWRVPFILGGVFGVISVYLRRYLDETPVFKEIQALKQTQNLPIKEVIKNHKTSVFFSILTTWVLTGCVVVSVLLTPNLLEKIYDLDPISKVIYQIVAIFFLASGNVFVGLAADKFGVKLASIIFGIALAFFALLFYTGLGSSESSAWRFEVVILFYYLMAFCAGLMVFTPLTMVRGYPASVRYSGISFAYNLSYAIFGGFTPIFFAWVLSSNFVLGLGFYYVLLACITIFVGIFYKEYRG